MPTASRRAARSYSRTSLPPTRTTPCVASYRRGMSCTRVVLAEPVPPRMPTVCPASICRSTSARAYSRASARYLKQTCWKSMDPVRHLDGPACGGGQGDLLVQHLGDAAGAGQGAGEEQKHVGDHHQRIHDLEHIAEHPRQVSHLEGTRQDHVAPEPQDEHRGGVHGQLEGGQVEHRDAEGLLAGLGELVVDSGELLLLILPPDKGLYRPDGGQPLLHHVVQPVHHSLEAAVHRGHLAHDGKEDESQHGGAHQEDHRQAGVHPQGQANAHHQHHRPPDQGPQAAVDSVLQNGDVGGHAGDQRAGLKAVQVGEGKLLHPLELGLPHPGAPAVGRPGGKAGVQQAGDQGEQGAYRHLHALVDDERHIPLCHADVDDIRHEHGDEQLKGGLHQHQQAPQDHVPPVGAQIGQQPLQLVHGRSPPLSARKFS